MQARPLSAIGDAVLDRLAPRPGETVLDAGAGSARTTVALAGLVGANRLTVVAASSALAAAAAERLPAEVELRTQELEGLVLADPVDAAVCVGLLHLVSDLDVVLGRLAAALRPGGRLEATCAGAGNVADVRRALAAVLATEPWASALPGAVDPWADLEAPRVADGLERAGFVDVRVEAEERVLRPEHPHAHLRAAVLGAHLARLPTEAEGDFVEAVRAAMDEPDVVHHVRLEVSARRDPAAPPPGLGIGETPGDLRRRIAGA